jgi:hypothetical protein
MVAPMPTNLATPADLELCARLSDRLVTLWGKPVSPRQIQQWRRLGIVPAPGVEHLGRRGTRSTYPLEAVDRTQEVAELLGQTQNLHIVVLGLFGVGRDPTERAVRNAYRWMFDRWEQKAFRLLAKFEQPGGGVGFAQEIRRIASSLGHDAPGVIDRWNRRARTMAQAERSMTDVATGQPVRTSSRDVRERDVVDMVSGLIDPEPGKGEDFVRVIGIDEAHIAEVQRLGGGPSFADMRSALDAITWTQLIAIRDETRLQWSEMVSPLLPKDLVDYFSEHLDKPRTGGVEIALSLLSGAALARRQSSVSSGGQEGSDGAVAADTK